MKEDTQTQEEVVVVAFGSQKKANLTGSVSQVKMDDVLGERPGTWQLKEGVTSIEGVNPRPGDEKFVNLNDDREYWVAKNPNASLHRLYGNMQNYGSNQRTSTKYLQNGAYMRLKVFVSAENPSCSWEYDNRDPKYRKFIDIMGADVTIANPGKAGQMKRLPISNWNAGNLIKKMPNLRGDNGPCNTASGYYLWKNYNCWELRLMLHSTRTATKETIRIGRAICLTMRYLLSCGKSAANVLWN